MAVRADKAGRGNCREKVWQERDRDRVGEGRLGVERAMMGVTLSNNTTQPDD